MRLNKQDGGRRQCVAVTNNEVAANEQKAATLGRTVRIVGVQAANAPAYAVSMAAGALTEVAVTPTIADGIAVSRPGALNFAIVQEAVDEIVTVSDDDTARALLMLLERAKQVVEPAGAVVVPPAGVAAIGAAAVVVAAAGVGIRRVVVAAIRGAGVVIVVSAVVGAGAVAARCGGRGSG